MNNGLAARAAQFCYLFQLDPYRAACRLLLNVVLCCEDTVVARCSLVERRQSTMHVLSMTALRSSEGVGEGNIGRHEWPCEHVGSCTFDSKQTTALSGIVCNARQPSFMDHGRLLSFTNRIGSVAG